MRDVIGFIDGLVARVGEDINPIVVFELRRQFNLVNHGIYFAIMYGLFSLVFLFLLLQPDAYLLFFIKILADASPIISIYLLYQFCFWVAMIPISLIALIHFFRWRDQLILLAMNEAELHFGFYLLGLYYMVKSCCLLYFWVVVFYLLGTISFDLFIIFPVVGLFSITVGNMNFSIAIIFRRCNIIVRYLIPIMIIAAEFSIITIILTANSRTFFNYDPLLMTIQLNPITTWNWLFVVFVMFPVFCFATHKIINFNLSINKPIRKKLLKSTSIYSILIIVTIIALYLSLFL
ncbi:MAG: hypothetical protein LBT09_11385 [Planctomycetaceae bacterium]|jgi:hypothetical protein|nr:hypothetical protein [Planctomycetaceae bacterium]